MLRSLFFTFFFAVAVVAVGMMVLVGAGGDEVAVAAPPELTELGRRMEGAHSRGAVLFQYNDGEGYALCEGTTYLVSLGPKVKEIKLTAQESLNLSLCRKSPETGNYHTVQDISGVDPGDYLVWGSTFQWTPYANAANMLATNQTTKVEEVPAVEAPVVEEAPMIAEEELLPSQAQFELSGSPAGNPALFVDGALTALINPGSSVVLVLEGAAERCGVSLQLKGSSGEWEHIHSFGCIDYGVSISLQVEGTDVTVVQ